MATKGGQLKALITKGKEASQDPKEGAASDRGEEERESYGEAQVDCPGIAR